ncbi:unnamed protein product [Brassica rapa subsp. narinosa]
MHQKSPSSPEETLHIQAVKPVFTTLNIPSITFPNLSSSKVKVLRTVKNLGRPSTYTVRVNSPEGIYVAVKPTSLNFTKFGEQKTFKVTLVKRKGNLGKGYVFGELVWSDKKHRVRSPIVVTWVESKFLDI